MGLLKCKNKLIVAVMAILLLCTLLYVSSNIKQVGAEEKQYNVNFNLIENAVYSGIEFGFNPTVSIEGSDEVVSFTTFVTKDGINECSLIDAGTYTISVTIYTEDTPLVYQTTFEISKRDISVNILDSEYVYGNDLFVYSSEITSGELVGVDTLDFISYQKEEGLNVGTYTVTGINNNNNYNVDFTSGTLTISPLDIDVVIDDKSIIYGDTDQDLTYVINGDLAYTDTQSSLGITLSRQEGLDVGEYQITGTASNSNYNVNFTSGTLTINPLDIDVEIDDKSVTYGDTECLTYTLNSSLAYSDTQSSLGITLSRQGGLDVGEYQITGTASNSNYNVNITSGTLTISPLDINVEIDDKSVTYGDFEQTLTCIVNDDLAYTDTQSSLGIILTRQEGLDVGEYQITGTASNSNYNVSFTSGTYTISQRQLIVKISDRLSVYGDELELLSGTITSGSTYEDLSSIIELTKQEGLAVGEYQITGVCTNSNYDITFEDGIYTITKRDINVYVDDKEWLYGDEPLPLTVSVSTSEFGYDDYIDDLNITLDYGNYQDAGEYKITATYNSDNYNVIFQDGKVTICKFELIALIDNKQSSYGDDLLELTYTLNKTLPSIDSYEDLNIVLTKEPGLNVGLYAITGVYSNDNYILTFTEGIYTINQAILKIKINDIEYFYGNENNDYSCYILDGRLAEGDDLSFITFTSEIAKDVGVYNIYGAYNNTNYSVDFIGGTITIKPLNISIEINDIETVYGNEDTGLTYNLIGDLAYEDTQESLGIVLSREEGLDVGEYEITGIWSNTNYNVTFKNGNYVITKRQLTIEIDNLQSAYGDDFETLTGRIVGEDSQLLDLSHVVLYEKEQGLDVGEYQITGWVYNDNYDITFVNGIYTITKKDIIVQIDDKQSVYGEDIKALSVTLDEEDLKYADTITDLNISLSYGGYKDAGEYQITASYSNDNYNVEFINGYYTISRRPLGVTINNSSSIYGDTENYSCEVSSGSLAYDDTLDIINITREDGNNVGTYTLTGQNLSTNYDVNITCGMHTVLKKDIVVVINNVSSTYGSVLKKLTFKYNMDQMCYDDTESDLSVTLVKEEGLDSGEYKISGSSESINYNVIFKSEDKTKDFGIYTIQKKYVIIKLSNVDAIYSDSYETITGKYDFSIFSGDITKGEITPSYIVKIDGETLTKDNFSSVIRGGNFTIDAIIEKDNYNIRVEKGTLVVSTPQISLKDVDTTFTYNDGKIVSTFDYKSNIEGLLPSVKDSDFVISYYKYNGGELEDKVDNLSQAGSYRLVVTIANGEAYTFKQGQLNYVDIVVNKKDLSSDIVIENAVDGGLVLKSDADKITCKLLNSYSGKIQALYTRITFNNEQVQSIEECGDYTYTAYISDDNYMGEKTITFKVVLDISTKIDNIKNLLDGYKSNLSSDEKLSILLEIREITTQFTADDMLQIEANNLYKQIVDSYKEKYNEYYNQVEEQFGDVNSISFSSIAQAFVFSSILLLVLKMFKRV